MFAMDVLTAASKPDRNAVSATRLGYSRPCTSMSKAITLPASPASELIAVVKLEFVAVVLVVVVDELVALVKLELVVVVVLVAVIDELVELVEVVKLELVVVVPVVVADELVGV